MATSTLIDDMQTPSFPAPLNAPLPAGVDPATWQVAPWCWTGCLWGRYATRQVGLMELSVYQGWDGLPIDLPARIYPGPELSRGEIDTAALGGLLADIKQAGALIAAMQDRANQFEGPAMLG